MAFTTSNNTHPSLLDRATVVLSEVKTRYTQYRVYRKTLEELQNLNRHELNDLGLNASMIKSVAYEAAYK